MGNVFGEEKTLKQVLREQKRQIDRSCRTLETERMKLKNGEVKLIADIKKAAKENQMKSVKIMAKDLVRVRKHQEKFVGLQAQLRAISLQMTTMSSTHALADSMKSATKAMQRLNAQLQLPALQKIMVEFAKQSEGMEMKQEMIGDAIEDAMDNEEDATETDAVVNQVLDEIGINMNEGLVDVPGKKVEKEVEKKDKDHEADKELENRLNNLKR